MSFAAPLLLLLILLVLPLVVVAQLATRARRRRYAVRLPSTPTLIALVSAQSVWRRWLPTALVSAALVFLVVAFARPEITTTKEQDRTTVELVTDTSGSMAADDVPPNRLSAAIASAGRFLETVPKSVRVGLVGYSDGPNVIEPPTQNRETIGTALAGLQADGGTATGDALQTALDALAAEGKPRTTTDGRPTGAILLLSDGKTEGGSDPLVAARRARAAGVPIYTVALGNPEGVTLPDPQTGGSVPGQFKPDRQTLGQIAQIARGQAFNVDDAGRLNQVYEQLGARVGTEPDVRQLTAIPVAIALLLLLGGVALGLRWRGRVA